MSQPDTTCNNLEIPLGIRQAKAALRKDLPHLLANKRLKRKWACYSNTGQVAIGKDYLALIGECIKRNIPDDCFIIQRIQVGAGSEEEEEVEVRRT